jgi:hypothetical protein
VVKVLGAIAALIAGTLAALATYRATRPAPPPATDILCPQFGDRNVPRGALCTRIDGLEQGLGALQAIDQARRAESDRQRKLRVQEPPSIKDMRH